MKGLVLFCVVLGVVSCSQFYWLSDWHVNPYYDPTISSDSDCQNLTLIIESGDLLPRHYTEQRNKGLLLDNQTDLPLPNLNYGQYGCDSPILLAQNAIVSMQKILPDPDFILYSGDFSAHDLPTANSRFTSINDTISIIAEGFPSVPLYPTLGNNDCYPDYFLNYWPRHANEWLKKVWTSWSVYSAIPDSQEETFINGGFYVAEIQSGLWVISLNTIYVCGGHSPDWNPTKRPDPAGQFAWLNSTLQMIESAGDKAYILGHIPPNNYWHHDYVDSYNQIINQYQNTITAQFFAHNHRDEFHLITDTERTSPYGFWMQCPSLTPKDGNNPGFRVMDYNRTTTALTDYTQYYTAMTEIQRQGSVSWMKEYQFSEAYHVSSGVIDTNTLKDVILSIYQNPMLYSLWEANHDCQYSDTDDILQNYCEAVYSQENDINLCIAKGLYQQPDITADSSILI